MFKIYMGFFSNLKDSISDGLGGILSGVKDVLDIRSSLRANRDRKSQDRANMNSWLTQQNYNSPSNQMNRFIDAGLNPNLLYGNISAGNATSAPIPANKEDVRSQRLSKALEGTASDILRYNKLKRDIDIAKEELNLQKSSLQLRKDYFNFNKVFLGDKKKLLEMDLKMKNRYDDFLSLPFYKRWFQANPYLGNSAFERTLSKGLSTLYSPFSYYIINKLR